MIRRLLQALARLAAALAVIAIVVIPVAVMLRIAGNPFDPNVLGRLAGMQAEMILVGKHRPGDLPVARMSRFAVVINMQVARRLKAYSPLDLLKVAETVN